jgi:hypothetical protein
MSEVGGAFTNALAKSYPEAGIRPRRDDLKSAQRKVREWLIQQYPEAGINPDSDDFIVIANKLFAVLPNRFPEAQLLPTDDVATILRKVRGGKPPETGDEKPLDTNSASSPNRDIYFKRVDYTLRMYDSTMDAEHRFLQLVLWGVGLAAPGFIGILSQLEKLKSLSSMSSGTFMVTTLVALLGFIVAIVSGAWVHYRAARNLFIFGHLKRDLISRLLVETQHWDVTDGSQPFTSEQNERIKYLDEVKKKFGDLDEYEFNWKRLIKIQFGCLIASYGLIVLLILSLRFSP